MFLLAESKTLAYATPLFFHDCSLNPTAFVPVDYEALSGPLRFSPFRCCSVLGWRSIGYRASNGYCVDFSCSRIVDLPDLGVELRIRLYGSLLRKSSREIFVVLIAVSAAVLGEKWWRWEGELMKVDWTWREGEREGSRWREIEVKALKQRISFDTIENIS